MCSKTDDNGILKDAAKILGRITMGAFLSGLAAIVFIFGGFLLFLSIMGLAVMAWWFPYIFIAAIPFVLIIAAIVAIFKK